MLGISNGRGKDGFYRYTREFMLYLRDSPFSQVDLKLDLFTKCVRVECIDIYMYIFINLCIYV